MSSLTVDPAPGGLRGRLRVPGDKSISHRSVLLSAQAKGSSRISGLSNGADVVATVRAVQAFGARVVDESGVLTIDGGGLHEPDSVIDVGNSGTGIRLMMGWASGVHGLTILYGDASIARRPMGRVTEPLRLMGARIDGRDGGLLPPLAIRGGDLEGIDYTVPVPSAQVKGAVLLAGLSAAGPTTVREQTPTRIHTEEMLGVWGARVDVSSGAVTVHPGPLHAVDFTVPGDPSQAAFWVVAACLVAGSDLTVEGVYVGPQRAAFLDVLRRMGAKVELVDFDPATSVADIRARSGPLVATDVGGDEVAGLIDEIPVLAVAAAHAEGVTTFRDAAELKIKESDRIASMVSALRAVGASVEGRDDGLVVTGSGERLAGGAIDSVGDHRVAMSLAVAALAATGPVRIEGWDAVATSYPAFEEDLRTCLAR